MLSRLARVVLGGCLLVLVDEVLALLLGVALAVLLGVGFAHLVLLHFGNLSAREDGGDAVVHVVHHVVEELGALEFEDEERVFLLVGGVAHAMLEFVELAEVLFPAVVDDV